MRKSIYLLVATLLMGNIAVAEEVEWTITNDEGLFWYRILSEEDKTAELYMFYLEGENMTIPQTVTYNEIEYTVTEIADKASSRFGSHPDKMKTLSLPSTLKRIGNSSLYYCPNLKAVDLPDGLEELGADAFKESSIEQVFIPASVRYVGHNAFNSNSLKSIVVSADNTVYDSREDCNAIIESATSTLILGCSSTQIPTSIKALGIAAFHTCTEMISVELPEGLVSIGDNAFYNCSRLQKIELPHSLVNIGKAAFFGCSALQELHIPKSVEFIGEQALGGSEDMLLSVESGNPCYDSREDCNAVIETKTDRLIKGSNKSIIPSTVRSIGIAAFQSCKGIIEVDLPEGLTVIEGRAFDSCMNLVRVSLPQSLTTIGDRAFRYTAIKEMDIPDLVDSIGSYTFVACRELERVKIPKTVNHFGQMVFGSCESLKEVNLPEGLTKIGWNMFSYCQKLTRVVIPSGVRKIEDSAFLQCKALASVNFPEGLETIGGSAFYGCSSLKQVRLPNSVRIIYSNAFDRCTALSKIDVGNQVEKIGWEVFQHTSIKEITLPSTLRECGQYIFAYCDNLKSITVCAVSPPRIENDWGVMVPNFSTITLYVPNGCTDAYRSAKEWKNFTNIVEKIPNGIMSPSSSFTTQHVFYDLSGRKIQGAPKKGVYIQGGKKHVVR